MRGEVPLLTVLLAMPAWSETPEAEKPVLNKDVVVYAAGVSLDEARSRIELLRGDTNDVHMRPFTALMAEAPVTISPGTAEVCLDPSDPAAFSEAMKRGDSALVYAEYDKAAAHLERAAAALRCMVTPVDPGELAKLHVLQGVLRFLNKDEAGSKAAFMAAHSVKTDLVWDAALPAGGAVFDAARTEVYMHPPARVYVEPDPGERWKVDGATPRKSDGFYPMLAGEHLLQLSTVPAQVMMIEVERGETQLDIPGLVHPELLMDIASEQNRPVVEEALSFAVAPGTAVYAVLPEEVWYGKMGEPAGWAELYRPAVAALDRERARKRSGAILAASGGGVAVIGGLVSVVGLSRMGGARAATTDAGTVAEINAASDDFASARSLTMIGGAVGLAGLATTGTGVVLLGVDGGCGLGLTGSWGRGW